jgi:DNA-binding protein HU-beta
MNKTDLITQISEKSQLTKKDSEKALNAFTEAVTEAVAGDDKVQLIGFGTFECRKRKERSGRDPRSGNPIKIPASNIPAFKAGKVFKDAVNAK